MKLTPKPMPGRKGLRVTFQRPDVKKVCSYGLGTADAHEAAVICNEVAVIFSDPSLLKDAKSPRLLAYHPRAVEIAFHGKDVLPALDAQRAKATLADADVGTLGARLARILCLAGVSGIKAKQKLIDQVLREYESRRSAELKAQYVKLENEVKAARPRIEFLEAELARAERKLNVNIKTTMGEAVEQWETEYKEGRSATTFTGAKYAVHSFMASLPALRETKLGAVKATAFCCVTCACAACCCPGR